MLKFKRLQELEEFGITSDKDLKKSEFFQIIDALEMSNFKEFKVALFDENNFDLYSKLENVTDENISEVGGTATIRDLYGIQFGLFNIDESAGVVISDVNIEDFIDNINYL